MCSFWAPPELCKRVHLGGLLRVQLDHIVALLQQLDLALWVSLVFQRRLHQEQLRLQAHISLRLKPVSAMWVVCLVACFEHCFHGLQCIYASGVGLGVDLVFQRRLHQEQLRLHTQNSLRLKPVAGM